MQLEKQLINVNVLKDEAIKFELKETDPGFKVIRTVLNPSIKTVCKEKVNNDDYSKPNWAVIWSGKPLDFELQNLYRLTVSDQHFIVCFIFLSVCTPTSVSRYSALLLCRNSKVRSKFIFKLTQAAHRGSRSTFFYYRVLHFNYCSLLLGNRSHPCSIVLVV